MFLSDLSIKRPVFATVLMLSLVTLGIFSYRRLAVDMYPDVEIPVVSIVTKYEGASPETVEREVTKRIEEAVNPISGVKHVMSYSRESVSTVVVEFRLEIRVNEASQEVRSKISAVRGELPKVIEEPIIQKLDFSAMPIISLGVRSDKLSPRDLSTLVEKKVKRRLESISGVGKVDLVGLSKREVNVNMDPSKLEALGMGVDQVIAGLQSENVNTPLGRLKRGNSEYPLRVSGKPDMVGEFKTMVIGESNGRPIKLSEVADVRDGIEEQRSLALVNGVPAVGLNILKQSGANTVGVVDTVKKVIADIQNEKELPPGTMIEMVRDGSVMIRDSVHDVQKTMVEGGILTILIVFLFLNSWRSTVITGLTLPISVISSFIIMNAMNMTLNIMTLMALSLAIGMLIDDAIVVRENIVRHLEMGKDHFQAARDGTGEIGLAVLATTFSIVAVFVPVAYMKGIIGRFFFQFGITVTFAVLVSLLVSFTLDPMMSSRWYDPDIERKGRRHLLARILDIFNDAFDRSADRYRNIIAWALDHRISIVIIAVVAFAGGMKLFVSLPSTFMQEYDRSEFQIGFTTAPDASFDETKRRVSDVLNLLKQFPEIQHTFSTIGAGDSGTVRDGSVYVKLKDKEERKRTQEKIQSEVRRKLTEIPGIIFSVIEAGRMHGEKKIQVNIQGEDIDTLKKYAARMKKELYKIHGIIDLEVSMEHDTPEYRLIVNRERATDAGVTTGAIVRTVGALVGGEASTTYEDEDGDAVDVRVRLPEELRQDASQVERLRLAVHRAGSQSSLIQLGDLVSYKISATPSEINRRDLVRQVEISANLDGLDMGSAMNEIRRIASELNMEAGYRVSFSGEAEDMVETFTYMAEALLLAVIFVYLILAAQFESFIEPFSIMFSLPLSVVGMAAMLYLTRDSISIMSLIGLIMLMGLVTKNAILLIDYAKILRAGGMERREAIITAGRTRLRPIIMTTLAMIFGMLPLSLGLGAGAEMRAPMARAVVGGLITSTLLTLLVVPVMYSILDDFGTWLKRKWSSGQPDHHNGLSQHVGMILIVFLIFHASTGIAADTPSILKLDDALKIASDQNKDIKAAMEYRNWVNGKYVEERSAALPEIGFTAKALIGRDETQKAGSESAPLSQTAYGGQFTLNQALFTWGKVGAAIRAAEIGMKTADDELLLYRQAVARDVSTSFYDVLLAKELRSIASQNLSQKLRHLDEADRKYSAGTATEYDVLSADVAVRNARPEVIQSENLVRISRDRLGILLGGLEGAMFDVYGSLESVVNPLPDLHDAVAIAVEKRPELSELHHKIGMQKEVVTIMEAQNKPRIDFQASYGWQDLDVGYGEGHADGQVYSGAIVFSYPFFDGFRTDGKAEQSRSDLRTMKLQEEKLRDNIRLQVAEALNKLRESAEILQAIAGTVAQAEKLSDMAEKGFIYGVKTNLDVQDAQLALKEARGNLAKARRDYLVAKVTLEWVMGTVELAK